MHQCAYAKLNITLDITGRRADGYHLLDSVFHTIDLCDTLSLTEQPQGISLHCTPKTLQTADNLVLRAAHAFLARTPRRNGVHFTLCKSIPTQAGLGGGSADAAAALQLLNRSAGHPHSLQQLMALGLSLGADVPFALAGGTQRVMGIGERLTPIALHRPYFFVLIQPQQGLSTGQIYACYDENPSPVHPHTSAFIQAFETHDYTALRALGGNALQQAAEQLCPSIAVIERALYHHGAALAAMTGSGSVVFGLFERAEQAAQAQKALAPHWPVCLCAQSLLPAADTSAG